MDMQTIQKAQYLEKKSKEAESSLQFINQTINELSQFRESLESFKKSNTGDEVFSQIGNRVYAKTELKEEKLLVDVGAGVLVKKTPEDAKKTVEEQLSKLNEAKIQITNQIEGYAKSFVDMMSELQKKQSEQDNKDNSEDNKDK